jgi:hypothetical protein
MDIWTILRTIVAIGTAASGLLALVRPGAVFGITGLRSEGSRGLTEIRAVFGGLFIALGLAPFFLGETAFQILGIGYAAVAAARLFGILVDQTSEASNWINLAIEVVSAAILLISVQP